MNVYFSWQRLWGLLIKELNQFRRDYTTFAMVLGIPIIQIILFGLAINTNPKHLPTVLMNADDGIFSRRLVQALKNTDYFDFRYQSVTEAQANKLLIENKALFILNIPPDFSRKLVRGEHPTALLEADGTDPVSIAYAVAAINNLMPTVYQQELVGPLQSLNGKPGPAQLIAHVRFNPEGETHNSIVPGLIGVILTMTLVMVTAMAITKERERGTMESLLITPVLPIEVILGKVLPYIVVGYLQAILILGLAATLFGILIKGSIFLLLIVTMPFILANLFVGISISTMTKTQLEASQLSTFFFLPSILLSGFAFPFQGMPLWAQWIGEMLPMTHFINLTRNIMLKGAGFMEIWPEVWPLLLFMLLSLFLALSRYRQTLD